MARNFKSITLILPFNNKLCNKERRLMFEHFKIHRELVEVSLYKLVDKDDLDLSNFKWQITQLKKACSIHLKLLQNTHTHYYCFGLISLLRVNIRSMCWFLIIKPEKQTSNPYNFCKRTSNKTYFGAWESPPCQNRRYYKRKLFTTQYSASKWRPLT